MANVVSTVPYLCDECQEPTWHLAAYGYDEETGEPQSCNPFPGDVFEDCDESDFPSAEAEVNAWRDYLRYVARTGEDPLNECTLPRTRKQTRRFLVRVSPWIGQRERGLLVIGAAQCNHGPRIWETPDEDRWIPEALWVFLGVYKQAGRWTVPGFITVEDFKSAVEVGGGREVPIRDRRNRTCVVWRQFEIPVECEIPLSPNTIANQLRQWAKQRLSEK